MGALILDAGVLIGALDPEDAHHPEARQALASSAADRVELIMTATALAEILVHPFRRGEPAVTRVDDLLRHLGVSVMPVTAELGRDAARLRAEHRRLRLADAVVLAAALERGATVLTTDRGWPSVSNVEIRVLQARRPVTDSKGRAG